MCGFESYSGSNEVTLLRSGLKTSLKKFDNFSDELHAAVQQGGVGGGTNSNGNSGESSSSSTSIHTKADHRRWTIEFWILLFIFTNSFLFKQVNDR